MFQYNGVLNTNINISQTSITAGLKNMIISQQTFGTPTASPRLADALRVDGTLFGDIKLYNSVDIGSCYTWADDIAGVSADIHAGNLLSLNRNRSPVTQSIRMGIYKFVYITTDQYLSKQAFQNEGSFSQMLTTFTGTLEHIKRVYDNALINSEIGLHTSTAVGGSLTVTPQYAADTESQNRLTAQAIARDLMILKNKMSENSRDYNELGYLRSYDTSGLVVVWNIEHKAKLTKVDLPTIFNNSGLSDTGMQEYDLGAKWFGNVNAEPTKAGTGVRISKGGWYRVVQAVNKDDAELVTDFDLLTATEQAKCVYLYEGDLVPAYDSTIPDYSRGYSVKVNAEKFPHTYTEDPDVVFVIMDKESLPFMSGYKTSTEQYNPKSLTSNTFLFWGHNKLEWIKDKPFVRVKLSMPVAPDNG